MRGALVFQEAEVRSRESDAAVVRRAPESPVAGPQAKELIYSTLLFVSCLKDEASFLGGICCQKVLPIAELYLSAAAEASLATA